MRSFGHSEAGNVALIGAATAMLIAGMSGFALNANRLESTADTLQRVADAAALGAVVTGQDATKTDKVVAASGQALAASMLGNRPSSPTVAVSVESRDPTRVSVSINEVVPTLFGGVLGKQDTLVTRKATAISQAAEPICLLVLNATEPETLRLKGSPELKTDACSIQVNSKAAKAVTVGGAATIDASSVSISGPPSPDGKISPKPRYNQPVLADPLADKLAWPTLGACPAENVDYVAKRGDVAPKPGRYCGGLTFASGANVTLSPGVYIVQSGSVSFAANAKVSGPGGVTIVLLDPLGRIDMQGGPDVNLQAPTSGEWKGVVIAIKPQPLTVNSRLNGGGSLVLGGVVYMPTQHLEMQGGSDLGGMPMSRGFVVNSMSLQGSGEITLAGDENLRGSQRNPRLLN